MSSGVLPRCAVPSVRRIPLQGLAHGQLRDGGGEARPFARWALVMAVRRRVIVDGRCVPASEVRYKATVSGVAGRAEHSKSAHQPRKWFQSEA